MNYKVIWVDFADKTHIKYYKNIGSAIKKAFAVGHWFGNCECVRISNNEIILLCNNRNK